MTFSRVGTLVLWSFIGAIGDVPLQPLSMRLAVGAPQIQLVPVFGPDTNQYIGLSLANTRTVTNTVTVT